MYRAALEYILGFKLKGDRLRVDPCIPRFWREFEITYRRGTTTYRIKVENPHSVSRGLATVELDGRIQPDNLIPLGNDGSVHEVRIVLGEKPPDLEPQTVSQDQEQALPREAESEKILP
jgi:cyclic beta-1,2-glucan synthetase